MEANIESIENLRINMTKGILIWIKIPFVIQYEQAGLPNVCHWKR